MAFSAFSIFATPEERSSLVGYFIDETLQSVLIRLDEKPAGLHYNPLDEIPKDKAKLVGNLFMICRLLKNQGHMNEANQVERILFFLSASKIDLSKEEVRKKLYQWKTEFPLKLIPQES